MEELFGVVTLQEATGWRPVCLFKKPQTPNLDKTSMIMKLFIFLGSSAMQRGNQGDPDMPKREEVNLLRLPMALDMIQGVIDNIMLAWMGG